MFEDVCILVIDKVSFLKDSELKTMIKHLQNIEDSHKPFEGYIIGLGGGGGGGAFSKRSLSMYLTKRFCGTQVLQKDLNSMSTASLEN